MLVVVDLEDESLRSDTRLPLESSPYMAGRNLNSFNWQLANFAFFPFQQPSPAILLLLFSSMPPSTFSNEFEYFGTFSGRFPIESYRLPELQVSDCFGEGRRLR